MIRRFFHDKSSITPTSGYPGSTAMKSISQFRRNNGKQRHAMLALALGGLLASGNALAGIPVIDPTQIAGQITEFVKEAGRWGEQGQQWIKEARQFQQQYDSLLSSVGSMRATFGLPEGIEMQKVDEREYVEERCGPAYGGGVGGMLGQVFQVDLRGDVYQQRYKLCEGAQMMRNRQYNETVEYLQEVMPKMQGELESAGDKFVGSGKTQGDMGSYFAKLQKVDADMSEANERYEARMRAYTTYIAAVERASGTLTRAAMRGQSGLPAKVASVVTMRQALCGGGQCD
ncbi:hypothetical protein FKV24_014005 [Lysobacter maris]|uniref:Uncharacterized protein n=1 Tax=Marilutibacter maris TaxID=1605891 RepID=A0A5N6B164_9GAMM|nr:hypothetical protein [Lysobacter maris]KAB8173758.1 hypothetical protein FKV24_014005 [Lysobacter maris]